MQIIQEEITALTDLSSGWTDEPIIQEVNYRSCTKLSDGRYEIANKVVVMSKEQVDTLIDEMENQLNTLADKNQMDMLALQDAQNQQAQLMQMMSNIQKSMHDTATAIIRNLK